MVVRPCFPQFDSDRLNGQVMEQCWFKSLGIRPVVNVSEYTPLSRTTYRVAGCKTCKRAVLAMTDANVFCSGDCRRENERLRNRSRRASITRWTRARHGYKQRFPKLVILNRRVSKCTQCHEFFEVGVAGGTRRCGECRVYRSRLKPTPCIACSDTVLAGVRGRYCERCRRKAETESKADTNARRRARIKGSVKISKVKRARVYERDQWTCGICHEAVDQTLRFPHPMSATLDHVVPLARLGAHDEANLQLAHLICNSIKSDGVHVATH
jgi:hypothetical protein